MNPSRLMRECGKATSQREEKMHVKETIVVHVGLVTARVTLMSRLYGVAFYEATIIGVNGKVVSRFGFGAENRLGLLFPPYQVGNDWTPEKFGQRLHKAVAERLGYEAAKN